MIQVMVNSDSLNQLLNRLKAKSGNLRPALVEIAGDMLDATAENFEKEGRPKWPDLASSTKKARAKKGNWPGKMLQVTGQLADSVNDRVTDNSAIVGTNKAYAAVHQFGGGKSNLPARPFLKLTKEDIQGAEKHLLRHLLK